MRADLLWVVVYVVHRTKASLAKGQVVSEIPPVQRWPILCPGAGLVLPAGKGALTTLH